LFVKESRREKRSRLPISDPYILLSPIPKGNIIIVCKCSQREKRSRLPINSPLSFLSPMPIENIIIVCKRAKGEKRSRLPISQSISLTRLVLCAVRYFASTPGRPIRTPIGNLIWNSNWREAMNRNSILISN
jgi:hypothetical protein